MFVYGMHTAQNMEVYKHISTIICNREVGPIIIKIWTRVITVCEEISGLLNKCC